MTKFLKQSTAITVPMGPFLDETDGVTPQTGLSSQTGRITKVGTGASFTASSWTHDWNGHYLVGLSTSHTDTLGLLRIAFNSAASYLPVWEEFMIVPANIFDSLVGGSDALQVDIIQWVGTSATSGAIPAAAAGANGGLPTVNASNQVDISQTAADRVWSSTTRTLSAFAHLVSLASAEFNTIADAVLKRDMSAVTGAAARSPLNALRFLRNRWSVSGGTLTVRAEDDSTTAWTASVTESGSANPITGVDPT